MKNIKKCQKCSSASNLVLNSKSKNGYIQYICRECNTERIMKYRHTKLGKQKTFNAIYKSIDKFPEKQKARISVFYAVRNGKLKRPNTCSVCKKNKSKSIFAYHLNYSEPLKVKWVCRNCHFSIHKQLQTIKSK